MNWTEVHQTVWDKLCFYGADAPASIPQATVLEGPEGCGKKELCILFFQWLQCENKDEKKTEAPCGHCKSCLKVISKNHTDLIVLEPQGQFLQVDQFREMKKSLYFSPMDSKTRFVIIDQAARMNLQAANSLLKTLEEPPSHTKFFLVTTTRSSLLPTILSRCQFLRFQPLPAALIEDLVIKKTGPLPPETLQLLTDWMQGGLSKLELLTDAELLESLAEMLSLKTKRPMASSQLVPLSEKWASSNLEIHLEWLFCLLSRAALDSHNTTVADLANEASHLQQRLQGNANRKLVALSASQLLGRFQAEGISI